MRWNDHGSHSGGNNYIERFRQPLQGLGERVVQKTLARLVSELKIKAPGAQIGGVHYRSTRGEKQGKMRMWDDR